MHVKNVVCMSLGCAVALSAFSATSAYALCLDGATGTQTLANGCTRSTTCVGGRFVPDGGCIPGPGPSCAVCGQTGTRQCNASCQVVSQQCVAEEVCNHCDDDANGIVDDLSGEVGSILRDPHVLDAHFYRMRYPDVAPLSADRVLGHWMCIGHAEGRRASAQFSSLEYLRQYPDLSAAYGRRGFYPAIRHYVTRGLPTEGRNGNIARPSAPPNLKVGMLYSIWHCLMKASTQVTPWNSQDIIDNNRPWGPLYTYHWWDTPAPGYYCLSEDDNVLIRHAEMLRDAGIDFVIVDASNSPWSKNVDWNAAIRNPIMGPLMLPEEGITRPFQRMLEIWSVVPGAPKIVPWVPIKNPPTAAQLADGCAVFDMAVFFDWKMRQYPTTNFIYDGKPLMLAVTSAGSGDPDLARCLGSSTSDSEAIAGYEAVYSVRKMWGLINEVDGTSWWGNSPGGDPSEWSFMSPCQPHFKSTNGAIDCDQRVSIRNGIPEQVSVTTAYQLDYMSNKESAVPKLQGETFSRQMETIWNYQQARVLTITGWNEWGAIRFPFFDAARSACATVHPDTCFFPDGSPVFVDQFDNDYNRDLEPGGKAHDFYYKLLEAEVQGVKGPLPAPPTGSIMGHIDGISNDVLAGWACGSGVAASIDIHLYVNGPYPRGQYVRTVTANQPSEPAVASACRSTGTAYRFSVALDPALRQQYGNQLIYGHGIAPSSSGQINGLISGSAVFRVPPI
jgi:hypothetical protein